MNRRGFIGSILALGVAPAIVRADSLMRVIPRATVIQAIPAGAAASLISSIREDARRELAEFLRTQCDAAFYKHIPSSAPYIPPEFDLIRLG